MFNTVNKKSYVISSLKWQLQVFEDLKILQSTVITAEYSVNDSMIRGIKQNIVKNMKFADKFKGQKEGRY
jgi:hypothetical protein